MSLRLWHYYNKTLFLQNSSRVYWMPESESRSVMSDSLWPHGLYSPWNSPGQNTGVDSLYLLQGIFPTQGSNPDLPHCGWILYQLSHKESPTILEWVAYPFSSRSSQLRNWTGVCLLSNPEMLFSLLLKQNLAAHEGVVRSDYDVGCSDGYFIWQPWN